MHTVSERLRRGKRPFRTYHLSTSTLISEGKPSETRLVVENQSFDETTHNELKIFESWATEAVVRNRELVVEMDPEERLEKLTEYMESCDLILRKQTDVQAKFHKTIQNIHSRLNSGQLTSTGARRNSSLREMTVNEDSVDSLEKLNISTTGRWPKSRQKMYGNTSTRRFILPPNRYSWDVSFDDYKPREFTEEKILKASWADPSDKKSLEALPFNEFSRESGINRKSHDGHFEINDARPQNPIGRTGISGRGELPNWGPNHAVDPIITRWKKGATGILEWIAVQRDTGEWAIPGGMVRQFEFEAADNDRVVVSGACISRIMEEKVFGKQNKETEELLRRLFSYTSADVIHKGMVDDVRATDNAWMETIAIHFHDEDGILDNLKLAKNSAVWAELRDQDLFGSHRKLLMLIADKKNASFIS